MNKKAKNKIFIKKIISLDLIKKLPPPKNNTALNKLITRILAYSAKKISAKPAEPYSILNPETNSDSPSAKSNGARLVSATQVTNHIREIGRIRKESQIFSCISFNSKKLNVVNTNNGNNKIKAILISYEIVWAIARNLPNRAYLEFEAHPANSVP